jgi:hypothetical protein
MGMFVTREFGRTRDFRQEIKEIEARHRSITQFMDSVNRVSLEKDKVLLRQIEIVEREIELIDSMVGSREADRVRMKADLDELKEEREDIFDDLRESIKTRSILLGQGSEKPDPEPDPEP